MTEELNKGVKETKNKGLLTKIKENVDDKEEQLAILSTFVRLGILIWSGAILTLAYIKLPPALGIPEQKLDPTFIASVFTGVLATFGVTTTKKEDKKGGITRAEIEAMMAARQQPPVTPPPNNNAKTD